MSSGPTSRLERLPADRPIDLRLTLGPLQTGRHDPTIAFRPDGVWLALATSAGPATIRLQSIEGAIRAEAWGSDESIDLALQAAPGLAGLLDEPPVLSDFPGCHPIVAELERRFPGLHLPRTGRLLPPLVAAVIGQKVTAPEAHATFLALVRKLGKPAPGPVLLLTPPSGADLAALPYFEFHPLGLERRRAEVLIAIGRREPEIEALMAGSALQARASLQQIPGIGPWTAAEATRLAFGDPDAVSPGDYHLPDLVSWALERQPRADAARMLELLAPYGGQRARAIRLLEASGIKIPRFGPRLAPRSIGGI